MILELASQILSEETRAASPLSGDFNRNETVSMLLMNVLRLEKAVLDLGGGGGIPKY